ncbi:MAG: butyrate kinase [Oscillospiraceae bacterium]|nr:butyrate kinase [Oscillospiraceae bacterium]
MSIRVFAINPGSTSTKIALFEDDSCLFSKNVAHDAAELAKYADMSAQLPYRRDMILSLLDENGVTLEGVDVFVGRGGGLVNIEGGVYAIDETVLAHARTCANGVIHPATLGPQLADEFARRFGARAMVVNPPDTDEFQDLARMTGIKGVYRTSHLHALNLKETAIRHAREVLGRHYEECNFIVCHIGGGISVSAHRRGKMVDGNDIVGGDGPMAPTRCGNVPVYGLLDYMEQEHADMKTLRNLATRTGGFVSHIGISDAVELTRRAAEGDRYAAMLWNTMIYQIEKAIGAMAAVLHGEVDGILLGGGMVHSKDLVQQITETCSFIAPVTAYPGEFEMEAMAAGAIRVLRGEEKLRTYTGKKVFEAFDFAT